MSSGTGWLVHAVCASRLRVHSVIVLCAAACLTWPATAQFRQDSPEVLPPPPVPRPAPPPDVGPQFQQAYVAAGMPRVVLLWNRELTDQTRREERTRQTQAEDKSESYSSLDKTTASSGGNANLKEGDSKSRTKTVTESSKVSDTPGQRPDPLSGRNSSALQASFVNALRQNGVRFVDRNMAVRATAGKQHRAGADAQLIEIDALVSHADLVLQVLLVVDKSSPLGAGFDVSVIEIASGMGVGSAYTRALPPPPPSESFWATTNKGFEKVQTQPNTIPSVEAIGWQLAQDVMIATGPSLHSVRAGTAGRSAAPMK